jgi:acyl-CoA thioesterase-1
MKRIFLLLVCLVLQPALAASPPPAVVVVGDSLSAAFGIAPDQGWVQLLRDRLEQHGSACRVVNASITGDTTRGGLARLPALLERESPAVVIIELGGNDGLRGITPRVMADNLRQMVTLVRAAGGTPVLLGVELPANYGTDFRALFHDVYYEVADDESVPLVPSFLQGVAMEPELMQGDGIHPNAAAQPTMLETVWPTLAPVLETMGCRDPGAIAQQAGNR